MTATLREVEPDPTVVSPDRPVRRRLLTPFGGISGIIVLAMAFITIGPLIAVAWRALAGDGGEGNIVTDVTSIQELPQVLLNTLILVVAAGVASLFIGGLLAWLSVRTDAGMGLFSDAMPMVPYLLPPIAGAVAWTMLLSPGAGFINAWLRDFLGLFGI